MVKIDVYRGHVYNGLPEICEGKLKRGLLLSSREYSCCPRVGEYIELNEIIYRVVSVMHHLQHMYADVWVTRIY